jgi:hypothetical protein
MDNNKKYIGMDGHQTPERLKKLTVQRAGGYRLTALSCK